MQKGPVPPREFFSEMAKGLDAARLAGNYTRAEAHFRRAVALRGGETEGAGDNEVLVPWASSLRDLSQWDESDRVFQLATAAKPDDFSVHFQHASMLHMAGRELDAAAKLRHAFEILPEPRPTTENLHILLARMLDDGGALKESYDELKKIVYAQPGERPHGGASFLLLRLLSEHRDDLRPGESDQAEVDLIRSLQVSSYEHSNKYNGFVVPHAGWTPRRISFQQARSRGPDGLQAFVRRREPVVVEKVDYRKDLGWSVDRWDAAYLKEKAGDMIVNVEGSGFGRIFGYGAPRFSVNFSSYIDMAFDGADLPGLDNENRTYYMNLQNGPAKRVAEGPVSRLLSDIPAMELLKAWSYGQINMWFGRTGDDGGTSLFHHDSSDNINCVLRGRKRWRIYSPADADKLYPMGKLVNTDVDGFHDYVRSKGRSSSLTQEVDMAPHLDPGHFSLLDVKGRHDPGAVNTTRFPQVRFLRFSPDRRRY